MTNTALPTDAEIAKLYAEETGFHLDDSPIALLDFARAVLARWDDLASALAECRDAFSMPPLGSKLELAWQAAIADPLAVPAYVQACLATHQAPEVRVPLSDEQADVIALVEFERHCGRPHPWEGAQPWVISAIKAAHGITAAQKETP